jgi:hypothetical protein
MSKLVAIEKAIEVWRAKGIKLLPPADEATILMVMKQIDRPVSRDVVGLYRRVGGFESSASDSHLWSFWPLARLGEAHRDYKRPYALFADYMINSHMYCFHYENAEVSSVYVDHFNGSEPVLVAPTVEDFFDLYLTDRKKLLIL